MGEFKPFYRLSFHDFKESASGVYIKKPQIIGVVENDGVNVKNVERMKYFIQPKREKFPLDLNMGIDSYKHRSAEYYELMLTKVARFIMNNNDELSEQNINELDNGASSTCSNSASTSDAASVSELSCSDEPLNNKIYEVITHRGVLAALMKTPNHRLAEEWTIYATQYNKKLYLAMKKKTDEDRDTPKSTHHFKFAQYCFTSDPNREPDTTAPINEEQQIYAIFKTHLDKLTITYSAEIDGIISEKKLENLKDINALRQCPLVCTKLMKDRVRNWTKNYRILGWWIKSYLSAVAEMYVGFKTCDGYVRQPLAHVSVNQLPKDQAWSPKVCNTFVHTFITKVIEEMSGLNNLYTCYEFKLNLLNNCISYRIHEGSTEYSFLPADFVEYLRRGA